MIQKIQEFIEELHSQQSFSPKYLRQIILELQSKSAADWNKNFEILTQFLQENPQMADSLHLYLERLGRKVNCIRAVTELGISPGDGFFSSVFNILIQKIFPEVFKREDLNHLISYLFKSRKDYDWLCAISHEQWSRFFKLVHLREIYTLKCQHPLLVQLLNSIQVISLRINTIGVDQEIIKKFPQLEQFESPFMAQHKEITSYIELYLAEEIDRTIENQHFKQIMVLLDQCQDYANEIRKKRNRFGVTFKMTTYLVQLRENINRLKRLLLIATVHHEDLLFKEEINLLRNLVKGSLNRKELQRYLRHHLELIAYQVTEHAGETGEHYITTDTKGYFQMLVSSCGGGIIVGFLSVFKLLASYLGLSLFGTAALYSLNYSLGFIAIHMTGSKLATKQPAMTATNLTNSLDLAQDINIGIQDLALKTMQVFRSQFVAFVGNMVFAFPIACVISYCYFLITEEGIATPARATYLIHELHPFESLAIFHAAIAGVYLFLSGLISGYVENLARVSNFVERLHNNEHLEKVLSKKNLLRLSRYLDFNIGAISGNFMLGIFLGSTSTIGYILGLPLDIRHITFSAGNFGIAFISKGADLPLETILISLLGIGIIGLTNFLVSFSLAMLVAVESRGMSLSKILQLLSKVFSLFIRYPIHFFLPLPTPEKILLEKKNANKKS